jgi:peptide/nickel transport system permease protein
MAMTLPSIFRRNATLAVGLPVLILVALIAIFGPSIAPADPLEIDAGRILEAPSLQHPLGTDQLGRDILSRMIYGARISCSVAVAAVIIATLIGVPLGLAAVLLGGRAENMLMRLVDVFVCLPEIFVAIVVLSFAKGGVPTLVLTIGALYFPQFAKVTHSVASTLKHREFVLAAVSLGARQSRIMFREILPNMTSIVLVQASFTLSFAMLLEAGLSFLGLGVVPPQPSWGQMVGELKDFLFRNPLLVVFPSLALLVTILAINMVGDWLQDYLNPEINQ